MYKDNSVQLKVSIHLSEPIQITKGLRQNCGMVPLLFNLYVEAGHGKWKAHCGEIGMPMGEYILFSLNFSDDHVVLAQDS